MFLKKFKKNQGEIFGITLLAVIIILAIIIFTQISQINKISKEQTNLENKYNILATNTLNTILTMSTNCSLNSNHNSVKDLIEYCVENSQRDTDDPTIICGNKEVGSCSYSIYLINQTLSILNKSFLGPIPYFLKINFQNHPKSIFNNNISNFKYYKYQGKTLTINNYLSFGFRRATSGLYPIPTIDRDINFELFLYYR